MLAPSVGPELVKFFPYLEDVRWTLVAIYGHIRDEFAEALLGDKILLRAKVHITESNITESDQLYGGHKVTSTGTTFDPFSASLRTFSYSRTSLILKMRADATLFWPSRDETGASTPAWPYLETLYVEFGLVAPSGKWYFKPPPGPDEHDSEDKNSDYRAPEYASGTWRYQNLREDVERTMMNPLVAALAKAVRHMPLLFFFLIK